MRNGSGAKEEALVPTRFKFNIRLEEINPWLATMVPLALQWQRGNRRNGVIHPLYAQSMQGDKSNSTWTLAIDKDFLLPVTLYKDKASESSEGKVTYKKKSLEFVLHEMNSGERTAPLARFVLDLSEFGDISMDNVYRKAVPLSSSEPGMSIPGMSIPEWNGDGAGRSLPTLFLTIECQSRKFSRSDHFLHVSPSPNGEHFNNHLMDSSPRQESYGGYGDEDGGDAKSVVVDDDLSDITNATSHAERVGAGGEGDGGLEHYQQSEEYHNDSNGHDDAYNRVLEQENDRLRMEVMRLREVHDAMMEEREKMEEMAMEIAHAIDKASIAEEKAKVVEMKYMRMPMEVRDAALSEVAIYSVVPMHGGDCSSLHTPARRLARSYLHSFNQEVKESVAGIAENMVSSILLALRSCGDDITRLSYWWSNVAMLRVILEESAPANDGPDDDDCAFGPEFDGHGYHDGAGRDGDHPEARAHVHDEQLLWDRQDEDGYGDGDLEGLNYLDNIGSWEDWADIRFVTETLLHLETRLYYRVLSLVWDQIFLPLMKLSSSSSSQEDDQENEMIEPKSVIYRTKNGLIGSQTQIIRNNLSGVERWEAAMAEAWRCLCPSRWANKQCGCIFSLSKQIMVNCVAKLDVAIFNALLREADDWEKLSSPNDPITDTHSLPFMYGSLNFNHGVQLKIAISSLSGIVQEAESSAHGNNKKKAEKTMDSDTSTHKGVNRGGGGGGGRQGGTASNNFKDSNNLKRTKSDAKQKETEITQKSDVSLDYFPLLRSLADILMLPKELLLDQSVRKEACGGLTPQLIRRIVYLFVPDGTSNDYVSPSLLGALNAEVKLNLKGKPTPQSSEMNMAPPASLTYTPPNPKSVMFSLFIAKQNVLTLQKIAMPNEVSSLLQKDDHSDDDLDVVESPLVLLSHKANSRSRQYASDGSHASHYEKKGETKKLRKSMGFKILSKMWRDHYDMSNNVGFGGGF